MSENFNVYRIGVAQILAAPEASPIQKLRAVEIATWKPQVVAVNIIVVSV